MIVDSQDGANQIQDSYWNGGQYGMGKPYSEDLRARVIEAAQDGGIIVLGYWQRRAGGAWSRWRR